MPAPIQQNTRLKCKESQREAERAPGWMTCYVPCDTEIKMPQQSSSQPVRLTNRLWLYTVTQSPCRFRMFLGCLAGSEGQHRFGTNIKGEGVSINSIIRLPFIVFNTPNYFCCEINFTWLVPACRADFSFLWTRFHESELGLQLMIIFAIDYPFYD